MPVIKHLKVQTSNILNSSIGATKKILLSLPLISQLYNFCTPFLDFLIEYLFVRHTVSPPLNIAYRYYHQTLQPISVKKLMRVAMVLTTSFLVILSVTFLGSDCVSQRNSCQSSFLVLTAFLNVIPVSFFSFQPPLSEFVLAISHFSVPTADVRFVLVFLQCYPAIPASKILWF